MARRTTLAALALLAACAREEPPAPAEPTPAPPEAPVTAPEPAAVTHARPPAKAGTWYPGDAASLRASLDPWLARATPAADPPIALISPHAGVRFSGQVAGRVHGLLAPPAKVQRVWLFGPSHHLPVRGVALPAADLDAYATPLGDLPIDRGAVAALRGQPGFDGPPRAHEPEHSLELNAIFLAAARPGVTIVPLVVGSLGGADQVRQLAATLRPLLRAGDVIVVSSDFTHYGPDYRYQPFPPGTHDVPASIRGLAEQALAPLLRGDLAGFDAHLTATRDTICGREPIRLLLALLGPGTVAEEVAWDTSGQITGDWTHSVSYLGVAFRHPEGWAARSPEDTGLPPDLQRLALRLARATLEAYLADGTTPDAAALGVPPEGPLRQVRGAFVTLEREGRLRGCIGHIVGRVPLWQSIRDNAIAAAVRDSRFPPVDRAELDQLDLEISVLTPMRDIPGPDAFEVGRHGVVLSVGRHRAVYLPQVAPDFGWDAPTTLGHLSRKAGLPPDGWRRPDARFQVFEAQVFAEVPHDS